MSTRTPTTTDGLSGDALQEFQLTTKSIKDKSSDLYGTEISKKIFSTVNSGLGGYYYNRNARFFKNRNYANGRMDVQAMFQDRFQFNGKPNYIVLNWNTLQIVNRIISGLVGRWMQRGEKVQVSAIDPLSVKDKNEEYEKLEFILHNRRMLEELQAKSGIEMIPQNDFIPADKEELNLWKAQLQRLPEEILYEMGCNDALSSNGWFDVLKEKMLHDAAEVLFVGTYTWMDETGVIHVEWVKPENAIYSYSEYPDFRDTSWRGQMPSIKISELRKRYGKDFGGKLTEEQLFDIAQKCKEFQYATNITWDNTWYTAFIRPYDEWNIRCMEFELKTVDSEPYTITKTKKSGSTYVQKGYPVTSNGKPRNKPAENQKVVEDSNWNIYRGVYLPDCEILLEWGLKKNMIRPQDPKEIGNAEFSYSFYMPQNYQMRNLAIPEKIEAAVDGMILALLKMQQIIAKVVPPGWAIDETIMQNVDYGMGEEGNKAVDGSKVFFQTGLLYYRGMDSEGNRMQEPPIKELANSGFAPQLAGYVQSYQFHYQALKDELGEDPNLITSALQPRVTAGNVEASQTQAEYATDYVYRAYSECMKITARKISCLLKDSVDYGSAAYRNIVKQEDISERQFSTDIKFLPTQNEIMRFEAIMNQALIASPDLVMFIDPFQLLRVAREDAKLAELLFRNGQKKMIAFQRQTAAENQQQTIQGQIASAKAAEEEKRLTKEFEVDADIRKGEITKQAQNQTAVLNMAAALLQKSADGTGGTIPANIQPLIDAVLQNVMIGAVASTEEQKQKILTEMQNAAQQQQQPPMQDNPPQVAA